MSTLKRPLLHLDGQVYIPQGPDLHLDFSKQKEPELTLDVSTPQEPWLLLGVSTLKGPELHLFSAPGPVCNIEACAARDGKWGIKKNIQNSAVSAKCYNMLQSLYRNIMYKPLKAQIPPP